MGNHKKESASILRSENMKIVIMRIYSLSNRWLGEELIRLARRVRADFPDELGHPYAKEREVDFVWHIIPEISKRLGVTKFLPNERNNGDISSRDNQQLRIFLGVFLHEVNLSRWCLKHFPHETFPKAGEILCNTITLGNPILFAMNKISEPFPPEQDDIDWFSNEIRKFSVEQGHEETAIWNPDLLENHNTNILPFPKK